MSIRVEIYGTSGLAVGIVTRAGRLREILESGVDLHIEDVTWHPLDGSPARPAAAMTVAEDDILLAVAPRTELGPVHADWHDIELEVGPYRVTGQMPTMPGFDPGRALARPTGEFVLLRDVRIGLTDAERPPVEQPEALVNRYVVERVRADLLLGFFFPGAEMVLTDADGRAPGDQQVAMGVSEDVTGGAPRLLLVPDRSSVAGVEDAAQRRPLVLNPPAG